MLFQNRGVFITLANICEGHFLKKTNNGTSVVNSFHKKASSYMFVLYLLQNHQCTAAYLELSCCLRLSSSEMTLAENILGSENTAVGHPFLL